MSSRNPLVTELTVLLSSAGRRGALVGLLRDGGRIAGVPVSVLATDHSPLSAAGHLADRFSLVPSLDSPDYIESLIDLVRRERVGVVVPTIDTELGLLAEHRAEIEDAGASVMVSSSDVIATCADKRRSSEWIEGAGFSVPRQYRIEELDDVRAEAWPLFFKPLSGSSSIGAHLVETVAEVGLATARYGPGVVEEFIAGDELTVDCWVDATGTCFAVVPRRRLETRAGEVAKGLTVADEALEAEVSALVSALPGARGPVTVQVIRSAAGSRFIEINPRFGGGYPLTHAAGAWFTAALVAEAVGQPVDPEWFSWNDGVLMLRYDEAVFLHDRDITAQSM